MRYEPPTLVAVALLNLAGAVIIAAVRVPMKAWDTGARQSNAYRQFHGFGDRSGRQSFCDAKQLTGRCKLELDTVLQQGSNLGPLP